MGELEQLRASEKHYRTLLDESSDPTFSFLPDGTYRYVNKRFADGLNLVPADIIGKTIWDIFSKDEADKRFAAVKRVFAEATPIEIEVSVPLPDHNDWYLTTVKPILNEDGSVESVICTSKDITKRKVAELSLQQEHADLEKAIEEIRRLSGLLPICSSCKNIRDDGGYWKQIEEYIQDHSEAQFSHTLCPHCVKELYPDLELPEQ